MNSLLIKELANSLKVYLSTDLNQTYCRTRYDFPGLSVVQRKKLEKQKPFERQILLKDFASEILGGSFEEWEKDAWIVHRWGGISKFNVGNHDRITAFRDALQRGNAVYFNGISSLSKIASFVKPKDFFVYDSRVAFALNGLFLDLVGVVDNIYFFPIPPAPGGRHIAMNQVITQRVDNPVFYPKQQAYAVYNQLILQLYKELFPGADKYQPCRVEMLLFELGKTNGVIAQKVGIESNSGSRKAKHPSKLPTSVINGTSNLQRGSVLQRRIVHSGFKIIRDGIGIYLFVGQMKTKTYCEILPIKGNLTNSEVLSEMGFEKQGGGHPYFIRYFKTNELKQAISLMNNMKTILSDNHSKK